MKMDSVYGYGGIQMVKKINALFSWILIGCLLGHLGTMTYSLLTGWYNYVVCKSLAHFTCGVFGVHVILSLCVVFFLHDGTSMGYYWRNNTKTVLQRASGIIMICLVHLHVEEYAFIVAGAPLSPGAKLGIIAVELLFWGSMFTHIAVSLSKSCISFGLIRTERAERMIDRAAMIICIILMILICFAMIRFVVMW